MDDRSSAAAGTLTWLILAGSIAAEVTATLSLKGAQTYPALYALTVAGYLAGFIGLALVLKRGMGLGVAYGIWGASGVALTAVLSALIFGEALTVVMLCGIALIIAGVLLVENGSHHEAVG